MVAGKEMDHSAQGNLSGLSLLASQVISGSSSFLESLPSNTYAYSSLHPDQSESDRGKSLIIGISSLRSASPNGSGTLF
jgi:hypothetical protein